MSEMLFVGMFVTTWSPDVLEKAHRMATALFGDRVMPIVEESFAVMPCSSGREWYDRHANLQRDALVEFMDDYGVDYAIVRYGADYQNPAQILACSADKYKDKP